MQVTGYRTMEGSGGAEGSCRLCRGRGRQRELSSYGLHTGKNQLEHAHSLEHQHFRIFSGGGHFYKQFGSTFF